MLEWRPLQEARLTAYVVHYTDNPNLLPNDWNRMMVKPKVPRPGVIISSLDPDTEYFVTVSAFYAEGEGPASPVQTVRTASAQIRPPGESMSGRGKRPKQCAIELKD